MKPANRLTPTQGNSPKNEKMRAIVRSDYGSPDVLTLEEVNKPVVPDNGVLVRVHAASINAGDRHLMRGEPFFIRLMLRGLLKPKVKILGFDVAGRVKAIGRDVTQFQPGDEVFGDLSECGFDAFAEYVCATEAALVLKPINISFEEAATVPSAAPAALQELRNCFGPNPNGVARFRTMNTNVLLITTSFVLLMISAKDYPIAPFCELGDRHTVSRCSNCL